MTGMRFSDVMMKATRRMSVVTHSAFILTHGIKRADAATCARGSLGGWEIGAMTGQPFKPITMKVIRIANVVNTSALRRTRGPMLCAAAKLQRVRASGLC